MDLPAHHHYRSKAADKSRYRTHRKVDVSGNDHQEHAESHDDDIAVLQHEVGQVDRLEENAARCVLEEEHDEDQGEHQAIFPVIAFQRGAIRLEVFFTLGCCSFDGHDAFPSARMMARMIFSWLASLAGISPTSLPWFIT